MLIVFTIGMDIKSLFHLHSVQESSLVVQALRLNTMSKLTFADSSRFDALVKDVFSGVNFTDVEDQILMNALDQVYKEARLELIPSQVCVWRHLFICQVHTWMSRYMNWYSVCWITLYCKNSWTLTQKQLFLVSFCNRIVCEKDGGKIVFPSLCSWRRHWSWMNSWDNAWE